MFEPELCPLPAVVVPLHETGLEMVRALGRRGVYVVGVDAIPWRPGARSRYCRRLVRSEIEGAGLIATLLQVGQSLGTKAALFACGDPQVLAISRHREELAPYYRFNLPEPEVVDTLMFKDRFAAYAGGRGYPIPRTLVVKGQRSLSRAASALRYPCIVKPAVRSVRWEAERLPKNYVVDSPETLRTVCGQFPAPAPAAIVQELIPGSDEDVYFCLTYFDRGGRPVASFVGRKLRQWPPRRGCTAIATAHTDAELERLTLRFLSEVGFRGLGSMEYRLDPRDGRWVMIEPTVGRIDLQSGVSELYGLSLPWIAYADLIGVMAAPQRLPGANPQAKWIHEEGVARLLLTEFRKGKLRVNEWRTLLRGRRRYAVFASDDRGPSLALLCDGVRRACGAAKRRFVRLLKNRGKDAV